MIMTAALNMGNQGCSENIQKPKQRMLRQSVDIRDFTIQNIMLPEGKVFNFSQVMRWQMEDLLNATDRYLVTVSTDRPSTMKSQSVVAAKAAGPISRADLDGEAFWDEMQERSDLAQKVGVMSLTEEDPHWPSCLRNKAHIVFQGQVNSFEMVSKTGLKLGFDPGGSFSPIGAGVDFDATQSSMDMGIRAVDGTWGWILGSGNATAKQTKLDFSFHLTYEFITVQPSYFFQTPFATVTKNGITRSINTLNDSLDANRKKFNLPAWEGRLLKEDGENGYELINAGRMHGVRPGDTFAIYDVNIVWDGPICQSNLLRRELTKDPAVIVQVDGDNGNLGDNYVYAKVIQRNSRVLHPGASVFIQQLVPEDPKKP